MATGRFRSGGRKSFRHALAVTLVSRRHPDLLGLDEEDRIVVAVCLWEEFEKGSGLYYLTTTDWADGDDLTAEPWSAPAGAFPDFAPGTHLGLIAYEPDRIHHAAWGGEWSFDKMLNTRLFSPVTPVHVDYPFSGTGHPQNYRGLKRQFDENPRADRKELAETMPFRLAGITYHLPIRAYYFEPGARADVGGKRNFVNPEHALMFLSNGQAHEHWTPLELRHKSKLTHLYDRLLVVVELDELPIKARTHLFPPDRQGFIDSDDTRRLTRQVAEFLDDWDELVEFDRDVLRKALFGERNGRPTINIARQIGRALNFRGGFTLAGMTGANGGKRQRKKFAQAVLYADPTTIEGPGTITIEQGKTRFTRFHINARDEFMASGRGRLAVVCDHSEIGEREITIGSLHNGFVRVVIAVPEGAALGTHELRATLADWPRASGGMGADLTWRTELKVIAPIPEDQGRKREPRGASASTPSEAGQLVGLVWRHVSEIDEWDEGVPGHVDEIDASLLAEEHADYKELAQLGNTKIPTIFLNRDYAPLKKYELARARELTERGLDEARDRYAVGTGLGLLLLDRDLTAKSNGMPIPSELELAAKQATAQSTLVMMPHYDRLAKEAGIEE